MDARYEKESEGFKWFGRTKGVKSGKQSPMNDLRLQQ